MIMKGLELLKKAEVGGDVDLALPALYSLFVKHFELGREGLKKQEFKFGGDAVQLTDVTYYGNREYSNSVSHFLALPELAIEFGRFNLNVDEYHRQGFVKIGLFDINDSIILGLAEGCKDEIWKLNGDWGGEMPYMEKIASDIFEFVSSCQGTIIQMNLVVRGIKEDQLYKNWGEDFWRVRPS
jgi:hypothetical protein